jgi:DNA invertase Pin-like site-specific DNA recombinase
MGQAVKAGLYLRISQDRDGGSLGVHRQELLCRQLAETRQWEVAGIYTDNDASAYRGKRRPAYEALLADLEALRINAVIAWHPDRLYRAPRDLERFVETVEAARAAVATVAAGELDLSNSSGRMVARILGAVARQESEHKADRVKAKHTELAAAGKPNGGGRPFGYNDDRVTIRPDEATLIREAAKRVLAGESVRAVHRDWLARGITGCSLIRRTLVSPRIAGLREHRGVIVGKAEWPAILGRLEWEELRSILMNPARDRRKEPPRRKYLLTGGLARCGKCGTGLVARPDRGGRRYICSTDHGGCNGTFIVAEPLEDLIREAVIVAVTGDAFDRARARVNRSAPRLGAELAAAEHRLDALARSYAAGTVGLDAYQRATAQLSTHIAELRGQVAAGLGGAVARKLPSGEQALCQWWDQADVTARADVVRLVIDAVVIGPGAAGANTFDPSRVEIRWKV